MKLENGNRSATIKSINNVAVDQSQIICCLGFIDLNTVVEPESDGAVDKICTRSYAGEGSIPVGLPVVILITFFLVLYI